MRPRGEAPRVPSPRVTEVEVLNLTGNIALADGGPKLHPHIVLGKADGAAAICSRRTSGRPLK
jgi:predicted DNA-binding protein with PD1-like motif